MRYGGERKRSTYGWSSQGGKLPRCVLPRTGAADTAELLMQLLALSTALGTPMDPQEITRMDVPAGLKAEGSAN
jgi:hypothetical protein